MGGGHLMVPEHAEGTRTVVDGSELDAGVSAQRGRPRVLVVDDDEALVELIDRILTEEGFVVSTARTGRAALDQVEAVEPALVLLDVLLPDISGFEVAVRLGGVRARVAIVFLTACDSVPERVRGLSVGGDDYIIKPFDFAELVARLRVVLDRAGRGPTHPRAY